MRLFLYVVGFVVFIYGLFAGWSLFVPTLVGGSIIVLGHLIDPPEDS